MKKIFLLIGLMLATITASATIQIQFNQDKPWRVFLLSDVQNLNATTHYKNEAYENFDDPDGVDSDDGTSENQAWINYNHTWVAGIGGAGSEYNNWQLDDWDYQGNLSRRAGGMTGNMEWDWSGLGYEIGTYNDGTTTSEFTNALWIWGKIGNEHCNVSDPVNKTWDIDYSVWGDDNDRGSQHDTYTRTADTTWHVQTGGKAVTGLLNLWQFGGSAWEILNKRSVPPFDYAPLLEISNKIDIMIGNMGNLGTNGVRYNLLPNGIEQDITPKVAGKDFYTFSVSGQQYLSYFDLYVQQANPGYSMLLTGDVYDVGHAFWQFRTEAPSDALQYISTNLTKFLGKPWGFYPTNDPPLSLWNLATVPGFVDDDSTHSKNIKRTYYVGFNGLINGLEFTRGIYNSPPEWSASGYNCVSAARNAGYFSGVHVLPLDMTPQNFGVTLIRLYPPILSGDNFEDDVDIFYSP